MNGGVSDTSRYSILGACMHACEGCNAGILNSCLRLNRSFRDMRDTVSRLTSKHISSYITV